jgi:predicted alpha/beta-fold hydrolase
MGVPSSKSTYSEENIDIVPSNDSDEFDDMLITTSDTGSPVILSDDDNFIDSEEGADVEYNDLYTKVDAHTNDTSSKANRMLFEDHVTDPLSSSVPSTGLSSSSTAFVGNIYEESIDSSRLYDDDEFKFDSKLDDVLRNDGKLCIDKGPIYIDIIRRLNRRLPSGTQESERKSVVEHYSRRLSNKLIRLQSSVRQSLPETPRGWVALSSMITAVIVGCEIQLQKSLTHPPRIYGQIMNKQAPIYDIYSRMIHTPETSGTSTKNMKDKIINKKSVIHRVMQPSLFVGTRSGVASTAAYLLGGPRPTDDHIQIREVLTLPADGTSILIDWELPPKAVLLENQSTSTSHDMTDSERRQQILNGPIMQPVVIIMHGINNDSSFGYVRSLMRACTDRGWIAVGMNFRGCGGVPLTTPRGYTGAYTGDIRGTIQTLSRRLAPNVPIFLVGNSLGANLVAKYLGEEGKCGTLPDCIAGGITLGNPMNLNAERMNPFWSAIIAVGAKKGILENYKYFKQLNTIQSHGMLRDILFKVLTLKDLDQAVSPLYIRNDPEYPFQWNTRGYESAKEYWDDASSSRVLQFVSVPLLQLIAKDDFLIFGSHTRSMNCNISNPNVLVMETACGGHLGWQESSHHLADDDKIENSKNSKSFWNLLFPPSQSWANTATIQFIQAVLESHQEKLQKEINEQTSPHQAKADEVTTNVESLHQANEKARKEASELRSRL